MKTLTILCLAALLCSCDWSDDDDWGCRGSSDYREFACIHRNDFVSANGSSTAQSRTLANCTILASADAACKLDTLPFLASENATPTKAQILNRLIVSHPWMADNFALLLDSMPQDMYRLFASVTAIVIHSEIRPAFFWANTGAIYIDPYYLWITQAQYNTISRKADYRSGFAGSLRFVSLSRYSKDGSYAFASGNQRSQAQTLYALSAMLFHELAHARDYFPLDLINTANSGFSPGQLSQSSGSQSTSLELQNTYPLMNITLYDMADVMYRGRTPSASQKTVTAGDMGAYLAGDGANDDYNYTSSHEDSAMLFEEVMMKIHFDINRDIVYATPLNSQQATCADFSFDWTGINRFADPLVLPRIRLVVDALLPGHTHDAFLASPAADGVFGWCQPTPLARNLPRHLARNNKAASPELIRHDHWH